MPRTMRLVFAKRALFIPLRVRKREVLGIAGKDTLSAFTVFGLVAGGRFENAKCEASERGDDGTLSLTHLSACHTERRVTVEGATVHKELDRATFNLAILRLPGRTAGYLLV